MRLVDIEPFDIIGFDATGDTAYDQGFEDGVQFVAEKIDAAPTIDAIPVEWLRHRLMMAQKNGSAHPEQAIRYVLWLWEQQKDGEQEEHST